LKNLSGQVDKLMAEGQVQKALGDARETLVGAKELFASMRTELDAVKLPQIGSRTRSLLIEMEATTEKLKNTAETLGDLAERLERRPSDLIFGKPPKPRWNEK
jgi:DNA repair ATPase RecN